MTVPNPFRVPRFDDPPPMMGPLPRVVEPRGRLKREIDADHKRVVDAHAALLAAESHNDLEQARADLSSALLHPVYRLLGHWGNAPLEPGQLLPTKRVRVPGLGRQQPHHRAQRVYAIAANYATAKRPLPGIALQAIARALPGVFDHVEARSKASRAAMIEGHYIATGKAVLNDRYRARTEHPEAALSAIALEVGLPLSTLRRYREFPGYGRRREEAIRTFRDSPPPEWVRKNDPRLWHAQEAHRAKGLEPLPVPEGREARHRLLFHSQLYRLDWYPAGGKRPSFNIKREARHIIASEGKSKEARFVAFDLLQMEATRREPPSELVMSALACALGIAGR